MTNNPRSKPHLIKTKTVSRSRKKAVKVSKSKTPASKIRRKMLKINKKATPRTTPKIQRLHASSPNQTKARRKLLKPVSKQCKKQTRLWTPKKRKPLNNG